ncbi:MAG: hypothetical protein ROO76_00205 [Terriglobia bacterium]|jgi:hypothetical protein|nr:hypothetical protein [Terriglobia bacterium]
MGRAAKFILIALLTFTLLAAAQTASAPLSREPGGTSPTTGTVNPASQSALIRILTPVASQNLAGTSTTVRFELTNPAAIAGTPNYLVQMDGRTPVQTSLTQQVFTGLTPAVHTITVELVDANGTPIQGGRAAVQFFVPSPTAQPSTTAPKGVAETGTKDRELKIAGFRFQQPDPGKSDDSNLPPASSPLPLISIIGFGVLVGGIISAMKTRS